MEKLEIFSQVMYNPASTQARIRADGILQVDLAIPLGIGFGVLHTYNIGGAGQEVLTKALTGGLTIAGPEDMPDAGN